MATHPNDRRRFLSRPIGATLLASLVMLVAACGSASNGSGGGNTPGSSGDGGQVAAGPEAPITVAAKGKPKRGGNLTYATEAEVDGFNPTKNRWAITGVLIGMAIFDPLAAIDKDGKPQPYLAEKWDSSADFKTWTVTLRAGVKFHNGEKLDADAVVTTYVEHQKSFLTGSVITNIDKVEKVDDLNVRFTMKEPWATFPTVLVSQLGVIPAPAQLKGESGSPQAPIGTGPFKLVSRTIDKETVVERNPDYWRKDADGTQLPYLDKITFLPVPENTERLSGLRSGQFQMTHTSEGGTIKQIRDLAAKGDIQKVEDQGESEEGFILLNLEKAPFDDLRIRKAMAMAIDREDYIAGPGDGVNKPADGVFEPTSPWYTKTDYPAYDPTGAKKLVDEYAKEKGPVKFTLKGGGPGTKRELEYMQRALQATGMQVDVQVVEQTTFIVQALQGDFEANIWRQWGEVDPDQDFVWWYGPNAKPTGQSSLNIGRNRDPKVDEALVKARSTTDVAERKKAYAIVQQQFSATLPYIWIDHSTWVLGAGKNVRGIANGPLPGGQESISIGGTSFPGTHRLTQVWLET